MILLTTDEIVQLHGMLLDRTGGSPGLREHGLLESACASVFTAFENIEKYPSIQEKAARLAYALTQNHPFVDGNKRIGIFAMLMTLHLNGVTLTYRQEELIDLGLGIAEGRWQYEHILAWISRHTAE